MHRNYFYIILGTTILCLLLIIYFFIQKPSAEVKADFQVEPPPFATYISAVGVVEPESGSIHISSSFNRLVEKINVSVNDQVRTGDVLFVLDNKDLLSNRRIKQQEREKAIAHLQELEAQPRKEDLMIAKEDLNKAEAAFREANAQYEMVVNLPNPGAISKEEQDRRLYGYQQAKAELGKAQAQFEKVQSGAFEPELKIAYYEIAQVKAAIEAIESEIKRTYIKSPLNGTVLKINIHEGETLDPSKPAMILGNIDELYLRVSIDQFNIRLFQSQLPAVAFRQGDLATEFPLKFIQMDPIMVAKKYLTNDINEKVDTQIFEVIYSISKNNAKLIIGEKMDVYINAEKK